MRKGGDMVQQEVSNPWAGRAGEDGVLEGLWSDSASWEGWVWLSLNLEGWAAR